MSKYDFVSRKLIRIRLGRKNVEISFHHISLWNELCWSRAKLIESEIRTTRTRSFQFSISENYCEHFDSIISIEGWTLFSMPQLCTLQEKPRLNICETLLVQPETAKMITNGISRRAWVNLSSPTNHQIFFIRVFPYWKKPQFQEVNLPSKSRLINIVQNVTIPFVIPIPMKLFVKQ